MWAVNLVRGILFGAFGGVALVVIAMLISAAILHHWPFYRYEISPGIYKGGNPASLEVARAVALPAGFFGGMAGLIVAALFSRRRRPTPK